MSNEKRKRSPNWLPSEKQLLLDLVEKHFNIIENKKTDGVTIKSKLAEWQVISIEYNSQTTNCHREAENLKSQWENMKKAAKKEASQARIRRIQTGGGPPDLKNEDPIYKRILSLINTSVVGLFNAYDNDNVAPVQNLEIINEENRELEIFPGPSNTDLNDTIEINCSANDIKISELPVNIEVKDWGDYTPKLLKMPLSAQLKTTKTMSSRRRPHHAPENTLDMLHRKKIEAINLQTKLASEEAEEKKILSSLDIEIKKEILKHEKLKTRLLLLELRKKRKEFKENINN